MTKAYEIQRETFIVQTKDGKLIKEHFGNASINAGNYSIANMIAPPGWSEPFQTPEFDEVTFIISGQKKFEINNEEIILNKGESIIVRKGTRVRYSNPFDKPVEYMSFCIPAFTLEKVHRENE